mgnify:CR=1 FL=1
MFSNIEPFLVRHYSRRKDLLDCREKKPPKYSFSTKQETNKCYHWYAVIKLANDSWALPWNPFLQWVYPHTTPTQKTGWFRYLGNRLRKTKIIMTISRFDCISEYWPAVTRVHSQVSRRLIKLLDSQQKLC